MTENIPGKCWEYWKVFLLRIPMKGEIQHILLSTCFVADRYHSTCKAHCLDFLLKWFWQRKQQQQKKNGLQMKTNQTIDLFRYEH